MQLWTIEHGIDQTLAFYTVRRYFTVLHIVADYIPVGHRECRQRGRPPPPYLSGRYRGGVQHALALHGIFRDTALGNIRCENIGWSHRRIASIRIQLWCLYEIISSVYLSSLSAHFFLQTFL